MGTNFHIAYIDDTTTYAAADMNAPLSTLDRAATYLKNIIVHCDGEISYELATGILTWAGTLRILFNRSDGKAIQNTVGSGSITLADNEFAYVDLNETNDTGISMAKAAVTTNSASNFIAYNRLVLAYRNTASNECFAINLPRTIPESVES